MKIDRKLQRPHWPEQHVPEIVQSFYRRHNCRKASFISERLDQIRSRSSTHHRFCHVEPYSLIVETSASHLRCLLHAIQRLDKRIAELFAQHPEHDLFDSFPGAGAVCGPRLLTVFRTDRSRWTSAVELQSHSGIAPVTEKSGSSCWIHHRLACAKFVKQAFQEFADQSIRYSAWARAYDDRQRSRGKDHQAAVRALAYKWIRIIFAVGRILSLMTKQPTSNRFAGAAHPPLKNYLDGATEMSMVAANPIWGAPRGELLKLGFEISERTISGLMPKNRKPNSNMDDVSSQSCRTVGIH